MKIGIPGSAPWEHGWQFAYVPEIFFDYRPGSMLTRTKEFESQFGAFVASKHSLLHRQGCVQIANQQESVKWTIRNFRRLLEIRLKEKLRSSLAPF